jgi:hypothetical protein
MVKVMGVPLELYNLCPARNNLGRIVQRLGFAITFRVFEKDELADPFGKYHQSFCENTRRQITHIFWSHCETPSSQQQSAQNHPGHDPGSLAARVGS